MSGGRIIGEWRVGGIMTKEMRWRRRKRERRERKGGGMEYRKRRRYLF